MDYCSLLAVDLGKFYTKYRSNSSQFFFKSRVYKLQNNEFIEPQGKTYSISYNGEDYIVGDQGKQIDYDLSKAGLNHKLSFFAALGTAYSLPTNLKVVLGCPLSIYKSKQLKKDFVESITDNKYPKFVYNGQNKNYYIDSVLVLPEGSGVVYSHPDVFREKNVLVIDIGGLNTNIAVYRNLFIDIGTIYTTNLGSYDILKELSLRTQSKFGLALREEDVEDFMIKGYILYKGKQLSGSSDLLEEVFSDFISKLATTIKSSGVDPNLYEVVFVGGTSEILGQRLNKVVEHASLLYASKFSNVEGFYAVGKERYMPHVR